MIRKLRVWEWIFLLIVLSTFLVYVHSRIWCPCIESKGEDITYGTMCGDVRNGDLIFLSGTTGGEKTCRWLTGSPFSHVGIVFREYHQTKGKDVCYVLECDIGSHHSDGIRIIKLKDKLKRRDQNDIVGYRRLSGSRLLRSDNFVGVFEKYRDKFSFDTNMSAWMWGSSTKVSCNTYHLKRKKMFCSEFACFALEALGICTFNNAYYSYSPHDLTGWKHLKMNHGMLYGNLRFLKIKNV